jgi:Fe-S cluster biogenesis protein NfuA/nitrite reductase/ring-hydroxylating ferredoxin subunit
LTANPHEVGLRVERMLDDLAATADEASRAKTEELISLLVEMYGSALARVLEIADERGPAGQEFITKMVEDDFLASLLSLHDLHPVDVETRVNDALEKVRPYLGSHAGGVDLLGVDGHGVAHLSLKGSCDGCPSSTVTVKMAIEQAILEAAPEVTSVEVQGVVESAPEPSLIQLSPPRTPHDSTANGDKEVGYGDSWVRLEDPPLSGGETRAIHVHGFPVLLCRIDDNLYAYRNECASCSSPLDGAALDGDLLVCTECGASYSVRFAGRSTDDGTRYLHALPLLPDDRAWRICLPSEIGS